jgi:Tol biopolymer transport system component
VRRRVAFVAMAIAAYGCRDQPPSPPPPLRLTFPAPDAAETGSLDVAISPDESQIVFVATSGGTTQLWRQRFADGRAEPLPGTDGAQFPAWKQTARIVSFFSGGRLKQIGMTDGMVADLAAAPSASGATWLRDGSLLFAPDSSGAIRRLLNGQLTAATMLAAGDMGHAFPVARWASDDFVYVAVRMDGRRVVRLVTTDAEHDLTTTSGHAVLVGDMLLHVDDGALLAYRLDAETARLPGRGIPVALDAGVSGRSQGLFAVSPRLLLHSRPAPRSREVAWLDSAGIRVRAIGDVGDHWQVRLSPDDRHAAVTTLDPLLRTVDVFVVPTTGTGAAERLTLSLSADMDPVWSPDGTRVLFRSMQDGVANLFARRVHTRGAPDEPILKTMMDEAPTDWRSGQILFSARQTGSVDVYTHRVADGTVEPIISGVFNESEARWSPDGRWLAYVSDESGQPDVYVQDERGARQRVSFGGGARPRWSRDSRTVFFLRGEQLVGSTIDGDRRSFSHVQPVFAVPGIVDFDVARRSDRIVVIRGVGSGARPPVHVVLNWTALLR